MNEVYFVERSPDYLEHHGILGQKWGIRRFQNPDGSLTEEGRKRYGDILTPDQMKNMIKSYNLRTGKNKKINKNTTFKTSHGTYDYKGRRIDTDTNIEDPGNKEKPEYNTKKKPSEMTDEELEYATARQKAERLYKEEYAKNNPTPPEKVSYAKQFVNNLRDDMVDTIPRSIAAGVGGYITKSLTNLANDSSGGQQKQQNQQNNQQQNQNKPAQQPKPQQNQNKQPKPQAPKEEPKAGPVTSDKEMDKDKKNVEVNLFGDKDAKLGYKVGRFQDKIVEGLNDVQSDFNRSKDKGANYTMDRRNKMASVAMESFKSSYAKTNPELHERCMAAVDRALTQTIKNASGSEYNKQQTFNKIVQDAYYDQMAAFMMQDTDMRARRVF